jgi:hydroxymethylbilane synthase
MKRSITIGTRGSQLALWQAEYVKKRLNSRFPDLEIGLQIIKTTGDKIQNRSLIGLGKGVFTKEIENALLDGTIDLAVHSMKDLPTELPDGLCIAAIPVREDPRDVLVSHLGHGLNELPAGAQVGTTSPRRRSQLLHLRSDLQVVDVRGNLDTRLRKLRETDLDAIILAAAGIKRLIGAQVITAYFARDEMVPAVGQGALGVETREDDTWIKGLLNRINDHNSETEIIAERAMLREFGAGCQIPIGANAQLRGGQLSLIGVVSSANGAQRALEQISGDGADALKLGRSLAAILIRSGAGEILDGNHNES